MKDIFTLQSSIALLAVILPLVEAAPFFTKINANTWIFGNELWNVTQKGNNAKQLYYKDRDLVGSASGHYYSSSNALSNFTIDTVTVVSEGEDQGRKFIDVSLSCGAGEEHWVIYTGLAGAYQYFVNKALPVQGEFRSLWRLDNQTFTHARTDIKDKEIEPLSWFSPETLIFDSTHSRPDGTYITKYDFTDWLKNRKFYGVYGTGFGSWYINPGKDYYNGDHLRQELSLHREVNTGDVVQLNMIHGTHFFRPSNDTIPVGKVWGPWLWYLNNGSQVDAAERAQEEFRAWPYAWFDNDAYQSRGSLKGRLVLSDGRPASNAAIFLGDNKSNQATIRQGSNYYYSTFADKTGNFRIDNIRTGKYGLSAWSNGSATGDISTTFLYNDLDIKDGSNTDLNTQIWVISNQTRIFRIGDFDRTAYGFKAGGSPYAYGLSELCPANFKYIVGTTRSSEWCYAQSKIGNWSISFPVKHISTASEAKLIVSLAAYSTNASSNIWANGHKIGELSPEMGLLNDGALYRSGSVAGDWTYLEFLFDASILNTGVNSQNEIVFQLYKNTGGESVQNTTQRGAMFDAIALEW